MIANILPGVQSIFGWGLGWLSSLYEAAMSLPFAYAYSEEISENWGSATYA